MAIHKIINQELTRSITSPTLGYLNIPAIDGVVTRFHVELENGHTADGDVVFNISINGVQLYEDADRLTLEDGTAEVSKESLSVAVSEGDSITLDIDELENPLSPKVYFYVFIDDGVADAVTDIGAEIHSATGKTTPVDADEMGIADSAASWVLKKVTFTNLKAFLKTYFDTLYASSSGGSETTSTLGALINGASAATPNNTDLVATVESSVVKKITWTNVKSFLKTYFDTLYAPIGAAVSDGDKGDVTVSGSGSVWTIDNSAVTTAKINNGAVTEAKLTLADNTTGNVSTSAHGFAPKGDGDTGKFLNANGSYSTPSADFSKIFTSGGEVMVSSDGDVFWAA